MIKISLSDLKRLAKHRPIGYYEEVARNGQIEEGNILLLEPNIYSELRRQYSATIRQPKPIFPQPIQCKDWPLWAKALAQFSKPEDKGLGDVVARMIGAENSEAFKKWFKATTGKDCGCTGRHARLNRDYPLP